MKLPSTRLFAAAALACAGAFGAPAAFAQGQFTAASSTSTCGAGIAANTAVGSTSCTKGTVTATLEAWGFTGNVLSSTLQTGFQKGSLGDFDSSGFGAHTGTNDSGAGSHHAFDNVTSGCSGAAPSVSGVTLSTANNGCGGSIEALFLNFGNSKVNLTNIGIGYTGGDADMAVWAWTGTGAANVGATTAKGSTTTAGTTSAALTGWTLVSNLDFGSGTGDRATNGTLYSSYFLVTTYFGAASGSLQAADDRFKLNSFTTSVCAGTLSGGSTGGTGTANNGNGATCGTPPTGVPEPGSLALVGLALVGGAAARRRHLHA